MTTFQKNSPLSDVLSREPIPRRTLVYFRARICNRIHALVLEEFSRLEKSGELNKAKLARRLGRSPEQITRWLGSPGNLEIETWSDLMLGMGCEPSIGIHDLRETIRPSEPVNKGLEISSVTFDQQIARMPAANDELPKPAIGYIPSADSVQRLQRPASL